MHSLLCHIHYNEYAHAAEYQGEREVSNIFCITQNGLHRAMLEQMLTERAHACKNLDHAIKRNTSKCDMWQQNNLNGRQLFIMQFRLKKYVFFLNLQYLKID